MKINIMRQMFDGQVEHLTSIYKIHQITRFKYNLYNFLCNKSNKKYISNSITDILSDHQRYQILAAQCVVITEFVYILKSIFFPPSSESDLLKVV